MAKTSTPGTHKVKQRLSCSVYESDSLDLFTVLHFPDRMDDLFIPEREDGRLMQTSSDFPRARR